MELEKLNLNPHHVAERERAREKERGKN